MDFSNIKPMQKYSVKSQEVLDKIPSDFPGEIHIKFGTKKNPAIIRKIYNETVVADCNSYVVVEVPTDIIAAHTSTVKICKGIVASVTGTKKACVIVYDNLPDVTLYGRATARLHGNAHVVAYEESYAVAWDDSWVLACDCSSVSAHGNATVFAQNQARVDAATNSNINATDDSYIIARDSSRVKASGRSIVKARENSTIMACGDNVKVYVGCGNPKVMTSGNSQIFE